jgi:hypothetical protein
VGAAAGVGDGAERGVSATGLCVDGGRGGAHETTINRASSKLPPARITPINAARRGSVPGPLAAGCSAPETEPAPAALLRVWKRGAGATRLDGERLRYTDGGGATHDVHLPTGQARRIAG